MALLGKLAATPGTDVTIISGRPRRALDAWFSALPLKLAAEHGAWVKENGQWTATAAQRSDWKQPILDILIAATERTPGSLLEGKNFSLVWHYRNVTPELAYVRKSALKHDTEKLLQDSNIQIFQGNKILEFKPADITKGALARALTDTADHDFILAIGDDYTDEDLFNALPEGAVTIKVGLDDSGARYHVASVADVHKLLARLAAQ
jgi:trehalose 6-phosphate synthase/phosphatase